MDDGIKSEKFPQQNAVFFFFSSLHCIFLQKWSPRLVARTLLLCDLYFYYISPAFTVMSVSLSGDLWILFGHFLPHCWHLSPFLRFVGLLQMLCAARPSFIHNTYVHIHACAYLYELKLQQCFRTWQHIELESWGGLVPLFIGHEMETLWSTHTQLLVARIGVLLGSVSMTLTHFKSCLQGFVVKF